MTATFHVGLEVRARLFNLRGHNRVMNDEHRETMRQIRDTYLPFHFMTLAYMRYPGVFETRSKRWQMIKARTVHHQRPNVWTGALRQAVLTESVVRATPTRGTIDAKAPQDSVVKFGKDAGKRIRRPLTEQRRQEMEFVGGDEIKAQANRMVNAYCVAVFNPDYSDFVLKQFR